VEDGFRADVVVGDAGRACWRPASVGVHERPDRELHALQDITQQVSGRATVEVHADRELVVLIVRFRHERCYRQQALRDAGCRRGYGVLTERLADRGDLDVSWKPHRHKTRRIAPCTGVSARGRSRRNIGDSADARWQQGSAITADPGKIGLAEPARYAPAVDERPPIQHVMAEQRRPFRKEAGRLVPRTITGQVRVR
jgi:hypothetical protein